MRSILITLLLSSLCITSLSRAEDPAPAPTESEAAKSAAASTPAEASAAQATPSAPAAPAKAPSDAPAATAAAEAAAGKTEKAAVDPIALKKAGYKLVNENGQELYCREDLKTGSHLKKTRTCLTERELAALQDNTRREIEYMRTRQPPPQGK